MKSDQSEQQHDAGKWTIIFPPPHPSRMELQAGQTIVLNGAHATVETHDVDQLEIRSDEFIRHLMTLGFQIGRNDSPEQIARILENVPDKYKRDFIDGVMGK